MNNISNIIDYKRAVISESVNIWLFKEEVNFYRDFFQINQNDIIHFEVTQKTWQEFLLLLRQSEIVQIDLIESGIESYW